MRASPLELARLEQHWALASIFVPLRRGPRERLDVTVDCGRVAFRVVGPWALGIDDLGLLLVLLRLASRLERAAALESEPRTAIGRTLAEELDVRGVGPWETLVIETSLRELGRLSGRGVGGANLASIEAGLFRLAAVTVHVSGAGGSISAHILGWAGVDAARRVRVALHPHVAAAVVGGPATLVDLASWRALRSEAAKRLLVWLSAWLREGETRSVGLDALGRHVWAEEPVGPKRASERRAKVLAALRELDGLPNWAAVVEGRLARITRRPRHFGGRSAAQRRKIRGRTPERLVVDQAPEQARRRESAGALRVS